MTKTEYIDKLREMVYDINPAEIASHIENDSLRQWIYAWHCEICNRIQMINLIKEIDKYNGEDVLDKIRAEIDEQYKWLLKAGYTAYNVDIAFGAIKAALRNEVSK